MRFRCEAHSCNKWEVNHIKRLFIAIIGGTVVLIGIVMIALPGPGLLVILAGLGILAIEFAWARHWLHKVRQYLPGKNGGKPEAAGQPQPPLSSAKAPGERPET